jgi:ornithine cyclodeaminase/alanine dehydrogenase-like protein (mu-crystallin family)
MPLLLNRREVEGLMDLDSAMDVTVRAFREQAADAVAALAPRHLEGRGKAIRIVMGGVLDSGRFGLRAGPAVGFPPGASANATVALLWDSASGELLSIMAYTFGTLRTGASVGVATRLFARQDAHVAAMLGTGRNALSLLRAVCHVRPIEQVRVYSRDEHRRAAFAERARAELGVPVEAVPATEAAVKGADVVCVATNSLTPVVTADQLSPGLFMATMGRPSEIDPSIYLAADRILVTHKQHEQEYLDLKNYRHELLALVQDGRVDWASDVHEVCDVVAGRVPARTSDTETIIFKESAGGFGDVAFCSYVYEQARRRGLGQEIEI